MDVVKSPDLMGGKEYKGHMKNQYISMEMLLLALRRLATSYRKLAGTKMTLRWERCSVRLAAASSRAVTAFRMAFDSNHPTPVYCFPSPPMYFGSPVLTHIL